MLAVLILGAGFAYALSPGGERSVRLGVLGLAALMALQLLVVSAQQRTLTRTLARSLERLRILELRTRAEGEELHQRVLEGIKREGLLLNAVTGMSGEIGRLRVLLESVVRPAPVVQVTETAPPAAVREVAPEAAPEQPPTVASDDAPQRAYAPTVPVTTWVVREIQVEGEPTAAVSMRILDLTDSATEAQPDRADWPTPAADWGQYARPA